MASETLGEGDLYFNGSPCASALQQSVHNPCLQCVPHETDPEKKDTNPDLDVEIMFKTCADVGEIKHCTAVQYLDEKWIIESV